MCTHTNMYTECVKLQQNFMKPKMEKMSALFIYKWFSFEVCYRIFMITELSVIRPNSRHRLMSSSSSVCECRCLPVCVLVCGVSVGCRH